jgi:hypothetical protein
MFARALALMLAMALAPGLALAARADFQGEQASIAAGQVAHWSVESGDHAGLPFAIVDKVEAKVFVFDGRGRLLGMAPALIGLATGDESVPGIGSRPISTIRPLERTTPAGRFAASIGATVKGDEILWVDYEGAVALHRVSAGVPQERRLQRLASASAADRRITYGCINVPAKFFDSVVAPAFRATGGIVYVLPETRLLRTSAGAGDWPGAPAPSHSHK